MCVFHNNTCMYIYIYTLCIYIYICFHSARLRLPTVGSGYNAVASALPLPLHVPLAIVAAPPTTHRCNVGSSLNFRSLFGVP